jgi:hypothetical protein
MARDQYDSVIGQAPRLMADCAYYACVRNIIWATMLCSLLPRGLTAMFIHPAPQRCASCWDTSASGLELHHLYSRNDGCPDDLTVWLCHVCHERAHQADFGGIEHKRLHRAGIERARAAGRFKGRSPTGKDADILRMADEGAAHNAIATVLGVSIRTVGRVLRANGKNKPRQPPRIKPVRPPPDETRPRRNNAALGIAIHRRWRPIRDANA